VDFTPPVEAKRWKPTRRISGAGSTVRPVAIHKTRRDSGRAVYGAGEPLRLAALSRSHRSGWQRKSILAEIATLLAGEDNATSATIDTLEDPRKRALIGFSLIRLPDQEKWSGDGAGLKAITGGDAVSVDPKYQNPYSTIFRR
jgi:hypothetical protein